MCSNARLGNDEGWTVMEQTVTMTGDSRSFVVSLGKKIEKCFEQAGLDLHIL